MFVVGLLLLGTAFRGAFEVERWGPACFFVLLMLAGLAGAGGRLPFWSVGLRLAVGGVWSLALLGVLSALWADAPAIALETGLRSVLYAGVFTVPIVALHRRQSLRVTAHLLTSGVAAIAVVTLLRLLVPVQSIVVAGRLDGPVGYRNATALLFCLGFWPLIVVAAGREGSRSLRSLAFALAELELGLAFLTQSRGVLIGFAAGGLVMVALGPDRVRRAWVAILALALLAACSPGLLSMYRAFDGGQGVPSDADITRSAVWLVALVGLAALAGAGFSVFDSGLRSTSAGAHVLKRAARGGLVLLGVGVVVAGLAAVGNPVTEARAKWHEFTGLQTIATGTTRYTNVGGQRYDLWRVAVDELREQPLAGVGAGNYAAGYYEHRHNDRNLDDPHGLVFQVGAELGILGLAALVMFLTGFVGVVAAGWRRLEADDRRSAVGMLATGAVLLGQSLVDWMWRIPGVAATGIFAMGIGVAIVCRDDQPAARTQPPARTPRLATTLLASALAVLLLSVFLSDFYVRQARDRKGTDTVAQLAAARRAHALSPDALPPLYLQASALESLGRRTEARRTLLDARRRVPTDFTTLGLIGDLEARAGRYAVARRWYRLALQRNPLDAGLQQLAVSGGRPDAPAS